MQTVYPSVGEEGMEKNLSGSLKTYYRRHLKQTPVRMGKLRLEEEGPRTTLTVKRPIIRLFSIKSCFLSQGHVSLYARLLIRHALSTCSMMNNCNHMRRAESDINREM